MESTVLTRVSSLKFFCWKIRRRFAKIPKNSISENLFCVAKSISVFAQIPFIWNFLAKFGRNWMEFWSWSWVIDAINIYLDLDLMSSTIWKEVMRSVELNWKEATKWVELNRKKVMNASLPFVSFQFNSLLPFDSVHSLLSPISIQFNSTHSSLHFNSI